jgi:hypothetical protein
MFDHIACHGELTGAIQTEITSGLAPFQYAWSNGATTPSLSNLAAGNYALLIEDANGCVWDSTLTVLQPEPLAVAIGSLEVVSCAGGSDGSFCVQGSGGAGPYVYSWQNGFSGPCLSDLAAGTYALTLSDANNCLFASSVSLGETRLSPLQTASEIVPVLEKTSPLYRYAISSAGLEVISFRWKISQVITKKVAPSRSFSRVLICSASWMRLAAPLKRPTSSRNPIRSG